MPWTETRPMQRLDFIRASFAGTDSFPHCAVASASVVKPGISGSNDLTRPNPLPFLTAHARHILIPVLFRLISSRI